MAMQVVKFDKLISVPYGYRSEFDHVSGPDRSGTNTYKYIKHPGHTLRVAVSQLLPTSANDISESFITGSVYRGKEHILDVESYDLDEVFAQALSGLPGRRANPKSKKSMTKKRSKNPLHRTLRDGKEIELFTPNSKELELMETQYPEAWEGKSPRQIEAALKRLRIWDRIFKIPEVARLNQDMIETHYALQDAREVGSRGEIDRAAKRAGAAKRALATMADSLGVRDALANMPVPPAHKSSPSKAVKKVNPARRKPSPATRLISRCHKLWEAYTKKPTKKALKEVVNHLDKMRAVTGERVKKEVAACSRAVSREARRLSKAVSR